MGWLGRPDASKNGFEPHAGINDDGYRPDKKKRKGKDNQFVTGSDEQQGLVPLANPL
jgi:hypothetical protein